MLRASMGAEPARGAATLIACTWLVLGCNADDAAHDAGLPLRARTPSAQAADAGGADGCAPVRFYRDRDGDGIGAGAETLCTNESLPAGYAFLDGDCDDTDPLRRPFSTERFGDGIDSNCDGMDDARVVSLPCSCHFRPEAAMPDVTTACSEGFEPAQANAAVANAALGAGTCGDLPDLAFAFVAQCNSDCYEGPIYVSIANVGGRRSAAAVAQLGNAPAVSIEALDPGERTSLIAVEESRELPLSITSDDEECSKDNNALRLFVGDYHCGFL